MSKRDLIYKLLSFACVSDSYDLLNRYIDYESFVDEETLSCLYYLYISLLCENENDKNNYYDKFKCRFDNLKESQKVVVKSEIEKIIELKNKPKEKKKER